MRLNLCKKDRQILQKESDHLTNLNPVKIGDFKDFPDLQRRWELELKRFTNIDADYNMGKYQKRNVLYRALPLEIQKEVDSVSARSDSSFEDYDKFIEFVLNLSRSWQYQRHALPKPLSTNIVEDQPPVRVVEEPQQESGNSKYYLQTDDGKEYVIGDKALPAVGKEALLSLTSQSKG